MKKEIPEIDGNVCSFWVVGEHLKQAAGHDNLAEVDQYIDIIETHGPRQIGMSNIRAGDTVRIENKFYDDWSNVTYETADCYILYAEPINEFHIYLEIEEFISDSFCFRGMSATYSSIKIIAINPEDERKVIDMERFKWERENVA